MKANLRNILVAVVVVVVGLLAWQAASKGDTDTVKEYPGFINHEELDIPEDVAAQWNIQLNTSRAAFDQDLEDFSALMNIAFWNRQFGDYAESRRAIEQVLESPAHAIDYTAWTMLGDVAVSMEDWDTAQASYVKSLDLHTDPNLYYKIEKVWRVAYPERFADIKGLYEEAIKQDGQKPFYLTRLGLWYAEQEMWQEAADHFKVIADMLPDDENAQSDYEFYLNKIK